MSETSQRGFTPTGTISTPKDRRRVVFATVVCTTVEWYDFFIYAQAAGLVFAQLFFAPLGETMGIILSFLTVGISFLFRPLGAFLAGHFGDKYGRRIVLVITLVLMGVATTLVGLAIGPYMVGQVSDLTGSMRIGVLSLIAVAPISLVLLIYAYRSLPQAEATVGERARQAV